MTEWEFHCKIVGVGTRASEDDIKHAYREAAKILHPDKHQNSSSAKERFEQLKASYDYLLVNYENNFQSDTHYSPNTEQKRPLVSQHLMDFFEKNRNFFELTVCASIGALIIYFWTYPGAFNSHDSKVVGRWSLKCSTIYNEGRKCTDNNLTTFSFYPDGQMEYDVIGDSGIVIIKGTWSSNLNQNSLKITEASQEYSNSSSVFHEKVIYEYTYDLLTKKLSASDVGSVNELGLKTKSYKKYDTTGFATVAPVDSTQMPTEFYVKTENIVK